MCDIPESLSLLQEAQEQLGQDQEQELLKQLKEQHQSVTKTAISQSHIKIDKKLIIQSLQALHAWRFEASQKNFIVRSIRVLQYFL